MKRTTWGAFGSVFINLALALAVAALFSAAPTVQAAEPGHCAAEHAGQKGGTPARPAAAPRSYLVAVRMGWAAA